MAASLLEQARSAHEDIERMERMIVQSLIEDPKTVRLPRVGARRVGCESHVAAWCRLALVPRLRKCSTRRPSSRHTASIRS